MSHEEQWFKLSRRDFAKSAAVAIVGGATAAGKVSAMSEQTEPATTRSNDELIEANKDLLKDDELLVVQGKVQPDRFSGGLRLNVNQVWSLAAARARFGRYLQVAINGALDGEVRPLTDLLRDWPAKREHTEQGDLVQGLGVRLAIRRPTASAELDLGDDGRFWPSDEALQRWQALTNGQAAIVYEG